MKHKSTYPNQLLIIIFALIITGCGVTKEVPQEASYTINKQSFFESLPTTKKPYNSLYIDKFSLRIDYLGQLRTQKSSLYHVVDSVIYLTITSTFSIPVACFYALPNTILIIDKSNKTIYESTYQMLEKKIGFPVTFSAMQNILFGYNDQLVDAYISDTSSVSLLSDGESIVANFPIDDNFRGKKYQYRYNFNKQNKLLRFIDIYETIEQDSNSVLEVNYNYSKNENEQFITSVLLDFYYDTNPLQIEIEFKDPEYNKHQDIKTDSTFTSRPLFLENE